MHSISDKWVYYLKNLFDKFYAYKNILYICIYFIYFEFKEKGYSIIPRTFNKIYDKFESGMSSMNFLLLLHLLDNAVLYTKEKKYSNVFKFTRQIN